MIDIHNGGQSAAFFNNKKRAKFYRSYKATKKYTQNLVFFFKYLHDFNNLSEDTECS